MSFIGLQNINISYGGPALLDNVNLQIHSGERICLLGRNGMGKTTLLKIINGDLEPDNGIVTRQQGIDTAMLNQEIPRDIQGSVYDVIISGLGQLGELPAQYHNLSVQLAHATESSVPSIMKQLDQIQKKLEAGNGWEIHRQAETIITRMNLDADLDFPLLSAGMKRRVLLARALVCLPEVLLLDEPTNHLDLDAITWIEDFLSRLENTIVFVTHDRMLVKKLATRIIELDRGQLTSWNCNYQLYLERKESMLDSEKEQWRVFDKKLAQEEVWIRQGIKARRKRNQGRVETLLKMREERSARREHIGKAQMSLQETRPSGHLVIEAENASFSYSDKKIIQNFNLLVMRGDRLGIIGPNGCGKTTLLQLLLGKQTPQSGTIRQGTNLSVTYFDQLRHQLDEEKTIFDNIADGSDRIVLDGKTRHVYGYLQEFLFSPERSRCYVKVLSGGERNRLLLAKLFAKPSNLIVMDEPTNDLDIETLELLEELLLKFQGTLLLVSHDRAFLNNTVTSTLIFESDGNIVEYIGGYDDWQKQSSQDKKSQLQLSQQNTKKEKTQEKSANSKSPEIPRKLSNKEKSALESLPQEIEGLEKEQEELYQEMADPSVYQGNGERITNINQRLEEIKNQLSSLYHRWEELEEMQNRYLDSRNPTGSF